MAHCINISHPDYLNLARNTTLSQRELKARIATWQEITNQYDIFPALDVVESLLEGGITTVTIGEQTFTNQEMFEANLDILDSIENFLASGVHVDVDTTPSIILGDLHVIKGQSKEFKDAVKQILPAILGEKEWNRIRAELGIKGKSSIAPLLKAFKEGHYMDVQEKLEKFAKFLQSPVNVTNMYIQNGKEVSHSISANPYSKALRKVTSLFRMSDVDDAITMIVSEFDDVLRYYEELPQYAHMERQEIIKAVTPSVLFGDVLENFRAILGDLQAANVDPAVIKNMQTFIDNYDSFAMLAAVEINYIEELKFTPEDIDTYDYTASQSLEDGSSPDTDMSEAAEFAENNLIDGWMRLSAHISVESTLSNKVKRALRTMDSYSTKVDEDNNRIPNYNIFGVGQKIRLEAVQNDLLRNLQDVIYSWELIPEMHKLSMTKPWVADLINELDYDNELSSQFYATFKKDETVMTVWKSKAQSSGVVKYEKVNVNRSEGATARIGDWRNNVESGAVFNEDTSVYNTVGKVLPTVARSNAKKIAILRTAWANSRGTLADRRKYIADNAIAIRNLMHGIGIDVTIEDIQDLFEDATVESDRKNFNIDTVLKRLAHINVRIYENPTKFESVDDLISENRQNYSIIADKMAGVLEEVIERSTYENGKSYYAYLQPSALSKLIKQLQNRKKDPIAFDKFIQEQFRDYEGTLYDAETDTFRIDWLNQLMDEVNQDMLAEETMLNYNKVDYDNQSPMEYATSLMLNYFSDEHTAYFHVPIMAETPRARFIKFNKITQNVKQNVVDKLVTTTFLYEYERIKIVRARKEAMKNDPSIQPIENFDDKGERFHYLTMLNDHIAKIDKLMSTDTILLPSEAQAFVARIITKALDAKAEEKVQYLRDLGLLEKTSNNKKFIHLDGMDTNDRIVPENLNEKISEYFYNSYLATANIIQLSSTDLTYFKNVEDFQKRNKQQNAPGDKLFTEATYNGERASKDGLERYMVIQDVFETSDKEVKDYISTMVNNNPVLSDIDKGRILASYGISNTKDGKWYKVNDSIQFKTKEHNLTDAQAYRSLKSARAIMIMHKGWNAALEDTYQRLATGTWDIKDYNTFFEAYKPFVYTQQNVDSKIPNVNTGENYRLKVPTQHKNSETILLPIEANQFQSERIKGLMQAMEGDATRGVEGIDVIMFESAVKVGKHGVVDISHLQTAEQITEYLNSFKSDDQYLKTIPYEDYIIQQPISDHLHDAEQLFGTQLRKLLMMDVHENMQFNLRGLDMQAPQIKKLYNDLIIDNIVDSYEQLIEEFGSIEKLKEVLTAEILGNSRYNKDLINALEIEEVTNLNNERVKRFKLPLFEPSQSMRVQQLLNSIWKSRVTKQKMRGGLVVQKSAFGYSDKLGFETDEHGVRRMQVYMPLPTNMLPHNYEQLGWESDGIIDVQKLLDNGVIDEEFLQGVAYRIPNENKYSTWPIKIVGFLPRNSGGNIIMPKEITTITGSDFDIDKMYLMLKEFETKTDYDIEAAWHAYYTANPSDFDLIHEKKDADALLNSLKGIFSHSSSTLDALDMSKRDFKDETGITDRFNQWFQANGKHHITRQWFETIKPESTEDITSESFSENASRAERNNLLIDIISSTLSNPEVEAQHYTPGGFDNLKTTARILNLIANGNNTSITELQNKTLEELEAMTEKTSMDMLDFSTQIELHKANMTAAQLIGMIANHNTNHAVRQNTNMSVMDIIVYDGDGFEVDRYERFMLNGKPSSIYHSLHSILNPTGDAYISTLLSSYLAAAVDAVKDPVLASFNLNTLTLDSAMYLTSLGYTDLEVGVLLRQPVIDRFIKTFTGGRLQGINKTMAIDQVIKEIQDILTDDFGATFDKRRGANYAEHAVHQDPLALEELANNIATGNRLKQGKSVKQAKLKAYYESQLRVALNYKNILQSSQELADFVSATRADTSNGAAGPDIATTQNKLDKIRDFAPKTLVGVTNLLKARMPEGNLRETLKQEPLGFVQAFTTLGLVANEKFMEEHFPFSKTFYRAIIEEFKARSSTGKISIPLRNQIYNEFFAYYMSNMPQFDYNIKNVQDWIKTFPEELTQLKAEDETLQKMELFKKIGKVRQTNNQELPIDKLQFMSGGKLSGNMRDKIMREWESLLYNPKYRKLAHDLFNYNFFLNGFSFGKNSFMHLAPTAVKRDAENYVAHLYKIQDLKGIKPEIFADQFYRNHLGDRKLVKDLDVKDIKPWIGEDNVPVSLLVVNLADLARPSQVLSSDREIPFHRLQIDGKDVYYKMIGIDSKNNATFELTTPLGFSNNFLVYNYGDTAFSTDMFAESANERDDVPPRNVTDASYDVTQDPDFLDHMQNVQAAATEEHGINNDTIMVPIFGASTEASQEVITNPPVSDSVAIQTAEFNQRKESLLERLDAMGDIIKDREALIEETRAATTDADLSEVVKKICIT